jgi:hypothetical protein
VPNDRANGASFVLEAIRQGFSNPLDGLLGVLLLIFLVVLVGVIAFIFTLRQREETLENLDDPKLLFEALAMAHGLSAEEKSLLVQWSSHQTTPHPEQAFVDPGFWQGLESTSQPSLALQLRDKILPVEADESLPKAESVSHG